MRLRCVVSGLSESTTIDLGVSYSRGHNAAGVVDGIDVGRFITELYGIGVVVTSWVSIAGVLLVF